MALPTVASSVSSGLAGYPSIYYDKVAVTSLFSNLSLYPAMDLKTMPDKSGVAMQIFTYTPFAANTGAATEGTPVAGQALTQTVDTITLSQYADHVSFSDKVVLTAISDTVSEGAEQLAYRGALSVDKVIATAVDVKANATAATLIDVHDGTYMSASVLRKAAMGLRSVDVKPKANGSFYAAIPSLVAYDLINDASAGGFLDLQKYTNSATVETNFANNRIGIIGQCEVWESNALPTETNWESSAHTAFHSYVFGKDAFFASSLGKTQLGQKNFTVKVSKFDQPISLDPANLIAAAASYNFFFGLAARPSTVQGFRRIRCESSIS